MATVFRLGKNIRMPDDARRTGKRDLRKRNSYARLPFYVKNPVAGFQIRQHRFVLHAAHAHDRFMQHSGQTPREEQRTRYREPRFVQKRLQ